jgi:cell division protein FtsI (penicillin-binding protein 3)
MTVRWGAVLLPILVAQAACAPATPQRSETYHASTRAATTLDPTVQRIAREELARVVDEWRPAAAVVVVLDLVNGSVLAAEGRDRDRDDPTLASRRSYVTGSTLKTFTIAAALDAGTINVDALVDCGARSYGTHKLTDPSEHGTLSVSDVLAVSSNVGTSRIYDTLGLGKLVSALHRFHVGDPPAKFPEVSDATSIEAATLASGELAEATPIQVAAGYAALFNGGVYLAPTRDRTSAKVSERVVRHETARTMIAMLERTITSNLGTGKLARIDGARVAGKTGTADLGHDHSYASFVGTVLDREPRFVALVGLEDPREGGTGPTAAAPAFARIARRLLVP